MWTSLAAPRDALIARGRWVWYWLRRGLWSDHILTAGPCRFTPAGGFAFFGWLSGLCDSLAQPRHRGRTASAAQCKKDRLAAVSPKSGQVFCSGGCDSSGVLPLPALAQEKGPSMTPGPFIAILEVASSGPSAVPQSGTN